MPPPLRSGPMAMINQSKRILITGAGRWSEGGEGGLGAALAIRLAGQGHTVVLNHRSSDEAAERLVEAIRNGPGRALAVRADVTDPDDVARMARTVRQELGGLDVLINNAGLFLLKDYEDLTPVEWESQIASTATATYYVSKTLLPLLREQRGRIINISDAGADRITPSAVYTISSAETQWGRNGKTSAPSPVRRLGSESAPASGPAPGP